MSSHPTSRRLLVEILSIIAVAGVVVSLVLPVLAEGASRTLLALLTPALLLIGAGPLIMWRLIAAKHRWGTVTTTTGNDRVWWLVAATAGTLVLGLAATSFTVFITDQLITNKAQVRFEQLLERTVGEIERRMMKVSYGLADARGVYAANATVRRDQFRAYVASRDLPREFPGAIAMGFIQRVQRDDVDVFVAAERADGAPGFAVRSLAASGSGHESAPDLYVIKYCYPGERNAAMWGLDIGSEPVRRKAVERAMRTGEPTVTGLVRLVEDNELTTGYLLFLPVYRNGSFPTTPEEREASLVGILYAPVILDEVLEGLICGLRGELHFEVFAGETSDSTNTPQDQNDTADDVSEHIAAATADEHLYHRTLTVTIGGRPWTIFARTTTMFEGAIDRTLPVLLGMVGAILSLMLAGFIWTLGSGRTRALRLAQSMTADLAAAQKSAERLADIARRTSNAVVITDPHGYIEWVNDGFTRITGYTLDEVKGRKPGHILQGPDTDPAVVAQMSRAVAAGQPVRAELVNYSKDGRAYWILIELEPLRDSSGVLTGFMAIESDVTQRKQAELDLINALKDARELEAALDSHTDSVILADASGRITRINPAFERLTGYTAAEVIGQPLDMLRVGQPSDDAYEALWSTIRAGMPWNGRLCNRRPRRSSRAGELQLPILGQSSPSTAAFDEYWVDASITPMRDAEGRVTGFVAIERDVTEAVAAEERERHRSEAIEARYAVAKVLNGMGELATRLGEAVEITFNMKNMEVQKKGGVFLLEEGDTHLRMFVWRGQFSQEFLRDEAAVPLGRCLCGRAALSGEVIVSDNCFTDHRHENHWPNMKPHGHYIVPLMDHSTPGRASCVGVMFLYTEVNPIATTERLNGLREIGELMVLAILKERANRMLEKARAAAENANRAKSAFLANMSHEIRTPLTAILGYADLLREEESATISPEQRTQTIDTIRRAGQHLLTIINDILDLSKIEAGRMSVERIETPLLGVLREVESFMRVRAAAEGLSLTTRLARPLPDRILSDPTRLRQILMNLVGNAVKFTETGGVTITADAVERDGQSRLVIDVEDTGAGLTEEQASRLFEPFSQADASTTRRFGGTGLGLTICRRLANLMGGDVTLHRTQPGRGSCFRVELPLVPAPSAAMVANLDALTAAPTPAPSQPRVSLRGRILLAEDGPDNQRLIAFHLRNAGAEVAIADNGRIALEMIDRAIADGAPFDLLLTDMQMPEMDGYTLVRTLRERGSTLPIIALTAHAMAEDRERCLQAGCDDFATKPIDKPALLATCAGWMGRRDEVRATAEAA